MKRHIKTVSYCLLMITVATCQKDDNTEQTPPSNNITQPLTIALAKHWYESSQPAVVLYGQSEMKIEKTEDIINVVQWNRARASRQGDYEVVEAFIFSNRMVYLAPDKRDILEPLIVLLPLNC